MVEYILLIAVVIVIMTNIFQQLNEYILTNPDSLQNRYFSNYRNMLNGQNSSFSGRYKNFTISR